MSAKEDRDDDSAETLVMDRSHIHTAEKKTPPAAALITAERPPNASQEPAEPRPSLWQRMASNLERCGASFAEIFFGSLQPLSESLPKCPAFRPRQDTLLSAQALTDHELGERMLLAMLRTSPRYQKAAIAVARRALLMRDDGPDAYFDFVVHFTISRIPPDKKGLIAVERLRDTLAHKVYSRDILPSLVRLKERQILTLVCGDNRGDPMVDLLHENVKFIELRVPV